MRERLARLAAAGTGGIVLLAVALFAGLQQEGEAGTTPLGDPSATPQGVQTAPDTLVAMGRRLYDREGCAACHSIARVGSPRSPLDGVGSRRTAEELRLWIVDPQAMRPGIRKPAYDDLPEEEVEALVAFMASLVAEND
jgi:mono/diheme cytochrome c family protein